MPYFFLPRTTSFVDLWNVETKIGHSRLNLISFDFIGLYHMTHFEDCFFLLCPDFVPILKNLKDKIKSRYLL